MEKKGGFIRSITFQPEGSEEDEIRGYDPDHYDPDDDAFRELPGAKLYRIIDEPVGSRLEQLMVTCPVQWEGNHGAWGSHAAFVKHLSRRPRPSLSLLELDGAALPRSPSQGDAVPQLSHLRSGATGPAVIDAGNFSKLWGAAPALEHLLIPEATKLKLGEVKAPSLRTLLVGCSAAPVLAAIARGSLPQLETLVVRVPRGKEVAALLANPGLGPLRHLGLIADRSKPGRQGDAVIQALLASPHLGSLETIDLGGWDASDAAWQALLAAAPRLPRLTELRLSSWRVSLEALEAEADEEFLAHFKVCGSRRGRPRDEAIGRALEGAFPVRWLTTSVEPVEESEDRDVRYGFSSNLYLDDWSEVERRGESLSNERRGCRSAPPGAAGRWPRCSPGASRGGPWGSAPGRI